MLRTFPPSALPHATNPAPTWLGSSGLVSMEEQTARCCAYSTRWHSWLQNGVALHPGHQLGRMRSLMGLPQVAQLQGDTRQHGSGGVSSTVKSAARGGRRMAGKRPPCLPAAQHDGCSLHQPGCSTLQAATQRHPSVAALTHR